MKPNELVSGTIYRGGNHGYLLRRIDAMIGRQVEYTDNYGTRSCTVGTFANWANEAVEEPTADEIATIEAGRKRISAVHDFLSEVPLVSYGDLPQPADRPRTLYLAYEAELDHAFRTIGLPVGTRLYFEADATAHRIAAMQKEGIDARFLEIAEGDVLSEVGTASCEFETIEPLHDPLIAPNPTDTIVLRSPLSPRSLVFHAALDDLAGITLDVDSLRKVRAFLEPLWRLEQLTLLGRGEMADARPAQGMCRLAAAFLIRYLDLPPECLKMGEPADPFLPRSTDGGFFTRHPDGASSWEIHAWIEIDGTTYDITADQFDPELPEVLVTSSSDPRYVDNIDVGTHCTCWASYHQNSLIHDWIERAHRIGLPTREEILAFAPAALSPR